MTNQQSILAVHSGALGDVILFGRLIERLGGPVTLVAGGEKARLLVKLGVAAGALDFASLPMHEIFTDTPLTTCRLPARMGEHDRLISCFAAGDRRAEMRLAAACGARDAAFLPIRPPEGCAAHLVELWEDMLGLPTRELVFPAWTVPPNIIDAARERLCRSGLAAGRFFAIHPGSGGVAKCWPIENFLELAEELGGGTACDDAVRRCIPTPSRADYKPLFIFGPAELERWDAPVLDEIRRRYAVLESPDLATLAGVLKLAAGHVGNDSGVSHLAAAVGTPTIALFGASRPEHFAPLGPRVRIVAGKSIEEIGVTQVVEAVECELATQRNRDTEKKLL